MRERERERQRERVWTSIVHERIQTLQNCCIHLKDYCNVSQCFFFKRNSYVQNQAKTFCDYKRFAHEKESLKALLCSIFAFFPHTIHNFSF